MKIGIQLCSIMAMLMLFCGCGEEYYATPEKTLHMYVENRMVGTRLELEACLNSLTKEDREWFEKHYVDICVAAYGMDCPGEGISSQTTVWVDFFEPAGPSTIVVDSSEIDEAEGTATLVVEGEEFYFVRHNGNWKLEGLFGVPEYLAQKYPKLRAAL